MANVKVMMDATLSSKYEKRFVVVDKDTGEVLDDAQGYGYKTIQKAYAAYNYKNRDKSKDAERLAKREHIRQWMREHKGFVRAMDEFDFEMKKGSMAPGEKMDAKFVKMMLKNYGLTIDFTVGDLLRVWRKW